MKWTECLHGAGSLREALTDLAEMTGARVVLVHRTCERIGRQRTISCVDLGAREGGRPITTAMGPALLASGRSRPRPGSVWSLGELDTAARDTLDDRCVRWMADRRLREVVAIPLDMSGSERDLLELYFPTVLPKEIRANLDIAAEAAAAAWRRREKGRMARMLSATPAISDRLSQEPVPPIASPLSAANPLGLTAAETRICSMVQSGYPTPEIIRHLRISQSTLRTHLRNIYAKTGVGGQVELVRLLLAGAPGTPPRAAV